jgi:hypothetical protein
MDEVLDAVRRNRASLARQFLLAPRPLGVVRAVRRLGGLQAQAADGPYVALAARLAGFAPADLDRAVASGRLVRATAMRGTLHLLPAATLRRLRPALAPVLERTYRSFFPGGDPASDAAILDAARELLRAGPLSRRELRAKLAVRFPGRRPESLDFAVRMRLPVVQVPLPSGRFGSVPRYRLDAEEAAVSPRQALAALLLRHIVAFGPSSLADVATWSGLRQREIQEGLAALAPRLKPVRDEDGRVLWDLPGAPRPPAAVPAPVRLLPAWDSLLLAYADRARVVPAAVQKEVYRTAGVVRPTFLVDGFVAGTWSLELGRGAGVLGLTPFEPLPAPVREALVGEARRLLAVVAPHARIEVRLESAS